MKALKRFFVSLFVAGSLFGGNLAHAGIPVIDVANLAQAIQQVLSWAQQYQQMTDQYQQLQQQYQQMQQEYAALTGVRGLGDIVNNPALQQVVPSDVANVYRGINQGGYTGLTSAAQSIRSAAMIYNCADRTGEAKTTCEAVLNTNAQTQAYQQNALNVVSQRVQQIKSLQSQINTTQDPKAIAELQARIQAENAQVTNDANRLAVLQAMADAQQQAAEQAVKERTLRMLAKNTPAAADTFAFNAP